MSMILTSRDRAALAGVHPDLVRVVDRAARLTPVPFRVFEGVRSVARQRDHVRRGVSRTMNSRHLKGPNGVGHAVDLVLAFDVDRDGDVDGADHWANPASAQGADAWRRLETAMKTAARELGVPVEWGGDWRSFKDYPHWQLPRKAYPADRPVTASRPAKAPVADPDDAVLRPGSEGARVRNAQAKLARLGYVVPVNGVMDARTVFVVRVVQRQNGLAIDGVLGPRTRTAIEAMLAAHRRGERAGAGMARADLDDTTVSADAEEVTEQAAAARQAAVAGGSGAVAGAGLVSQGVDQAVEAARHGQAVFSPGTVIYGVLGVAVSLLLALQAWRMLKRAGALPGWLGGPR